jgi:hypothetical protein
MESWNYGLIEGIMYKSGLYDNEVFERYAKSKTGDRSISRDVLMGATNLNNAKYVRFE